VPVDFLYGGVQPLVRILVVGSLSYLCLLVAIRLAGQRPLGRMQSFDLIIAVAIGSMFGRLLTAQEVQFSEAAMAILLLVGIHYVVSALSYRFTGVAAWIETEPVLLYYQGRYLQREMRRHRITEAEIRAAARRGGHASLGEVEAIVLESDGSFSVLRRESDGEDSTMLGLIRPPS
jgi:uncharacterized membrane protein YcaP (DUF421 family)